MGTVVGATFAFPFGDLERRALNSEREVFAGEGAEEAARRFLEQIHEDAVADDIDDLSVDDMVALSARFWEFAHKRAKKKTLLRIEQGKRADGSPLGRDILEIVTADKQFLVDSVMGEINEHGVDVLAMFHPIVDVPRDKTGERSPDGKATRESFIQVHLQPLERAARTRLLMGVRAALSDVEAAVGDYRDMRARMDEAIAELQAAKTAASKEERDECIAFLTWLRDDHFAFLGCRNYEFATAPDGSLLNEEPEIIEASGRGVLRDPESHVLRRGSEPSILTPAIRDFLREASPLIVAKSNMRSRVHRRVYMDYIGVKQYSDDGEVVGETRFVGLFTAAAYLARVGEVPLLRRKMRRVLERADKRPGSHNFKQLKNILETYPRDELFQSDEDELLAISLGILHLLDRPRPKLFIRRDRFDRFVSAFAYIPRERYTSQLREQIAKRLASAFNGRLSAFYPNFGDGPLARVHFIIGLTPFNHPEPDIAELEREIAVMTRTWADDFARLARDEAPAVVRTQVERYENAFSAGYRETFKPADAINDAALIEGIDPDVGIAVYAYHRPDDAPEILRFKLYHLDTAVALSDVMPTLENMGLRVIGETPFPVKRLVESDEGVDIAWIHDFEMRVTGRGFDYDSGRAAFEDAFTAVWTGRNENDGFNRLILQLGVPWRDVCFLRACARYRQQTGLDPSQLVQEEALADNPEIARLILEQKRVRFDPAFARDMKKRAKALEEIDANIAAALDAVASIDADRVLRRMWRLVGATKRTNFYQTAADGGAPRHIALKIASQELDELPDPKPYREIFVWAPHVEGVHLRFGPVARGGLRWSDRRDDFRTEVLGLVKAQQVKNAVIVPVGAKGGFYPKQLPRGGSREEILEEGVRAYKSFVGALLEITDNIVDDEIVRPDRVVMWDDEDPYLVVAADKGTAAFSDIANSIAVERGFWLGDAFASGGSAGYDHKKMGITARGGWVAVQRHFREIGKNIQAEPFTVIGVGDMSGDVFGNGMLLSRQIRLVAAFDHRHIFIDPDPGDPEIAWEERKRLFDLPRSSWTDYDAGLISKGGGVFARSLKTISLSPEIQELTGLKGPTASPNDLMRALLKTPVELLWFGGIGTYVKAPDEQDWEVGDKSNDGLRVTSDEVGAQVVGEGANLAVTQAGRIACARRGVRLNADFVDNAAGVDSSDHEVNIKILVNQRVRSGAMTTKKRNTLLASMTEDVAEHVLANNYDQTLALSIAETSAADDLDAHERLIERLEARGLLNRAVEGLPNAEEFRELKAQGIGLTRPEIAVLVSYSKISLFKALTESAVPDDPYFERMLTSYFPPALSKYSEEMRAHRLRREIIATVLANDIVNLGGATFAHRARESTGGDTDGVAFSFEAARAIFGTHDLLDRIHALDNIAPAETQTRLYREVIRLVRRQTHWLMRQNRLAEDGAPRGLEQVISLYKPGVDELKTFALNVISPFERTRVKRLTAALAEAGAPEDLARDIAELRPLTASFDVIDLAAGRSWPVKPAARLYHTIGNELGFDRMRASGAELSSRLHWDRLAVRRLVEDLYAEQQRLTRLLMGMVEEQSAGDLPAAAKKADADWAGGVYEAFFERNRSEAARARETYQELSQSGPWTLSKLAIAVTAMREFAGLARG